MGSFSDDDEECRFFDAPDSISSMSDSVFNSPGRHHCSSKSDVDDPAVSVLLNELWIRTPQSVRERREMFLKLMGLSLESESEEEDSVGVNGGYDVTREERDRILDNSAAVLSSSQSSLSNWSTDTLSSSRGSCSNEILAYKSWSWDDLQQNRNRVKFEDVDLDQARAFEEFGNSSDESTVLHKHEYREAKLHPENAKTHDKGKRGWLSRLNSLKCIINRHWKAEDLLCSSAWGTTAGRVKVRECGKRLKQLSALFKEQDIKAHVGPIFTMKFSLDGQYLASGGEDCVVRIWQVVEVERSSDIDILGMDPSCMYFKVNHLSQLSPIGMEKEKINKLRNLGKSGDSACVIFPPKVFRILEKPLHVFEGHSGEILDLSWSKDNCLLSSSTDKTVRLWRVGYDQCLNVFRHTNYVTSVQFNPVSDDYFISGSIDGKVRIWAVKGGQVLDWTEVKDIVTAVCYRPDGQGGVVGSIGGTCWFFSVSDNHIQLEEHLCLTTKKKSPCKRITGFQFFPQDPAKLLVTCADSQVRVFDGMNLIRKYKGLRNAGSQLSASFTSDGKHIVSASEDLNVYVWNCTSPDEPPLHQPKVIKSFECFPADACVVTSWPGIRTAEPQRQSCEADDNPSSLSPFSSSTCFSLLQEFLESIPRGSATWPEEKLSISPEMTSPMCKSQYKFLKSSCHSLSSAHSWGLVIVTAGWDGHIRSYTNYGLPVPI